MVDFAKHTARIINRVGQPVTITPSGQPARVVNAVFSAAPSEVFGIVGGYAPTLRVCVGDGYDMTPGALVSAGGKSFVVASISDDGGDSGDMILKLESA